MLAITLSIPIISLNVIGLNTQKVEIVRMDKKKDSTIWCLQETHLRFKDQQFESKSMEKHTVQMVTIRKQEQLYQYRAKWALRQEMLPEIEDISNDFLKGQYIREI